MIPSTAPRNGATVKLSYPFEHDGLAIETVTLRRPRVADTIEAQRGATTPSEIELKLVSILTGLPPGAVEQLDMKDYASIQAALQGLLSG